MKKPDISVIVPVYNSENTLSRCINSLKNQVYKNIELIFVDDGSTDNSKQILMQEKDTDERICVFSQKNSGPSVARNAGLAVASGKYVMFCDSDDTVDFLWCQVMLQTIEKNPNAWITCSFRRINENDELISRHTITGGVYDKDDYYLLYSPGLTGSVCNKIFRKDVINAANLKFQESVKYAEDVLFNLDYLKYVDKMIVIPECYYNYYFYNSTNTLSSHVEYEQLFNIYNKRLNYISLKYQNDFEKLFWYTSWKKLQEELFDDSQKLWRDKINNGKKIVTNACFQKLLSKYGEDAIDKKSLWALKHDYTRVYWLIQILAKMKRKWKISRDSKNSE